MTDPKFEYAPFFYFCTDDDGTILDINQRLYTKLQFDKMALIGKKQDIIFTIATRIFQQTHLFPLLKIKNTADEILITLQTKTNSRVSVLFNIERQLYEDRHVTQYAGIEIAQRKEYEERLLRDKKIAESALLENTALNSVTSQLQQKLEALDDQINLAKKQAAELKQFNKVITHDLEEPLRKLSLFASMLAAAGNPEKIHTITGKMLQAAAKTKAVIAGLQQYIWLSEAQLNPVELNPENVIEEVLNKLTYEWPGIIFTLNREEMPVLCVDKDQFMLLISHLFSNVIRFRKPGNKAAAKLSAKLILLNKFQHTEGKYKYADYIRFELKDDGIGFEDENKEQVFDLFRTLHDTSGLGIGLALCKMIIDNHGGTILLNSTEAIGTTVIFTLPVNRG